ncbi:hypothetical protein CDL15_Pgr019159 [Punica granatum]|uniref:Uncharacterized protein n=1 Tax=Punica granatum TaxID=22663 RepID=A0A218WVL0_PUNGR|nr:hypothetical protein CDL15_Pgr019159 [Punica granatum]
MQKYKSPNSSKSRMFNLASGCQERVGEEFESRVTRWNSRKDVRVHSWTCASMQACRQARGAQAGVQERRVSAQAGARGARLAGVRASARLCSLDPKLVVHGV